jgi:hypothetical protein
MVRIIRLMKFDTEKLKKMARPMSDAELEDALDTMIFRWDTVKIIENGSLCLKS